jgi:hypothetical protein
MPTYLCRWPNGTLSIAVADDIKELSHEILKDDVCSEEEWDTPDGMVIEMPKGCRMHFSFDDEATLHFHGFPKDALSTVERLYPHVTAAMKVPYKTKKAALRAAKGG